MATVVMPFLMSMLLGRTIDLTTYHIGGDIYDPKTYEETPRHLLNSTYTVLQENVFPYSHLGIPPDIVLRIKADVLHSSSGTLGLDGLLKETTWKSNSVVIAVTTAVQTVLRELKKDAPLLDNWTTRLDSGQTHYVNAQLYGGWSVILYRFKCKHAGQEVKVRKLFTIATGVSGAMNDKVVDLWQKAMTALEQDEDLKDDVEVEVHTYSSARHSEDVTSPDSLLKAINKFPDDVGKLGQPLFVELKPLHDLNHKFPIARPNHDLEEYFWEMDQMYDDVRSTKMALRKWMLGTSVDFTDKEEQTINNLWDHVTGCTNLFNSFAAEASIYKSTDSDVFKSAFLIYRKGLVNRASSYRELFLKLREDIDPECADDFAHKIRGILQVADDEMIEAGGMKGGLEDCKALCLEEPKCRSIRYAQKLPVMQVKSPTDTQDTKQTGSVLTFKEKQCWLYFRSSRTAKVVLEGHHQSEIYDRKCFKTEMY